MSEENKEEVVKVVDTVEKTHTETVSPSGSGNTGGSSTGSQDKNRLFGVITPVVFLLFMIFAMVVVLAVINLNQGNKTAGSTGAVPAIDPLISAHQAEVRALRSEINRERIAMGLSPLPDGFEPMDEVAKRLKEDADTLVLMAGKFQQMLAEKDSEITTKNAEILRLERLRQDVSADNARLQSELSRALISGSEIDQLKLMISRLEAQRDALTMELEKQKVTVDPGIVADLERRLAEAQRTAEFYRARAAEMEKAALFAKSADELLPAAVELFRRLRKLEGVTESELNTEYSKLGVELEASVLHTLDFKTGSSELSQTDKDQLVRIVENEVPDGDLAFIVGYASKTGDSVFNQKLSSDRATVAAEYFSGMKRQEQKVQAVYLGQTDRFSRDIPERNQICEIWLIRRK
ncbi:MAG: OmpA family protein [Akkermansiaceae bacterium]